MGLLRRRRLGVFAYDNELVIRNWNRTYTIPRGDVIDFRIETPSLRSAFRTASAAGAPVVHVAKQDGSMFPIHATAVKFGDPTVLNANAALLRDWLRVGN